MATVSTLSGRCVGQGGHVMPAETLIATTSSWHLCPTRATLSPACSPVFFCHARVFFFFSSFVSQTHIFLIRCCVFTLSPQITDILTHICLFCAFKQFVCCPFNPCCTVHTVDLQHTRNRLFQHLIRQC